MLRGADADVRAVVEAFVARLPGRLDRDRLRQIFERLNGLKLTRDHAARCTSSPTRAVPRRRRHGAAAHRDAHGRAELAGGAVRNSVLQAFAVVRIAAMLQARARRAERIRAELRERHRAARSGARASSASG